MGASASIGEILATTLIGLGLPAPTAINHTILLKDRYFVGHKYRYDSGYAIQRAGSNVVEFFDDDGTPLTTAAIEPGNAAAA